MKTADKISTLWIVVLFNMVFADVLGFMYPGFLQQVATGRVDGIVITPAFLLVAAMFIQLAICMVYVTKSRCLDSSRLANMIAAVVTIAFVVGGGSFTPHYMFFATFEVAALIYVWWLAYRWV